MTDWRARYRALVASGQSPDAAGRMVQAERTAAGDTDDLPAATILAPKPNPIERGVAMSLLGERRQVPEEITPAFAERVAAAMPPPAPTNRAPRLPLGIYQSADPREVTPVTEGIVPWWIGGPKTPAKAIQKVGNVASSLFPKARAVFPEGRAARAPGTPYEAPTIAETRPRGFKAGDFEMSPAERSTFEAVVGPTVTKQKVTWADAKALADELAVQPEQVLKNVRGLSGEEVLSLKNVISQDANRLNVLGAKLRDPAVDAATKATLRSEIEQTMERISDAAARVHTESSQFGRDLNLMKVMGRRDMDPGAWLVFAQKTKGNLPLTAEEMGAIGRLAGEKNRTGLYAEIGNLRRLDTVDKYLSVWKAGLLTNPLTQGINVAGNTGMAIAETAKDVPAAIVDAMVGMATGVRTKGFPRPSSITGQIRGALGPGIRSFRSVIQHGASVDELARWDFRGGKFGKTLGSDRLGHILDAYTQSVFRPLAATDELFNAAAIGRSLEDQIRLRAPRLARASGISVKEAVKQLKAEIPPDIQAQAVADAAYSVFREGNSAAEGVISFLRRGATAGPRVRLATNIVLPFQGTPTRIGGALADYSPLGAAANVPNLYRVLTGRALPGAQRQVAEAFGRAGVGSGLIWLGWTLAEQGLMTGDAPRDAGSRAQQEVRSQPADALKITEGPQGIWLKVGRITPMGMLLSVGARLHQAYQEGSSPSDVAAGSASAIGGVLADQPFLQGIQNITEAAQDPVNKGARFARGLAQSHIPAVVSAAAREIDPIVRQPDNMGQAMMARVPGLSTLVPPKVDALGRDVDRRAVVPGGSFFDIFGTTRGNEPPMLAELRRLQVTLPLPSTSRLVSRPRPDGSIERVPIRRTRDEQRAYSREAGPLFAQAISFVISDASYASADDNTRRRMLERALDQVSDYARQREQEREQQDNSPVLARRKRKF